MIDLPKAENYSDWFLGINPRGLVPVLVHDGVVHIESNDILAYIEKLFPTPALVPPGREDEIGMLLREEDDLHLDLRSLSVRFLFGHDLRRRDEHALSNYRTNLATVQGRRDSEKEKQLQFWEKVNDHGVTNREVRDATMRFRAAFDRLEGRLQDQPYLVGRDLTSIDIAWFVYANRLLLIEYPLQRLHPRLADWFVRLGSQPAFLDEVAETPIERSSREMRQRELDQRGESFFRIAGLE